MSKVKEEVDAWQSHRNNKECKINWQFTNKDVRVKLKKLYPSIQNLHNTRIDLTISYFIILIT